MEQDSAGCILLRWLLPSPELLKIKQMGIQNYPQCWNTVLHPEGVAFCGVSDLTHYIHTSHSSADWKAIAQTIKVPMLEPVNQLPSNVWACFRGWEGWNVWRRPVGFEAKEQVLVSLLIDTTTVHRQTQKTQKHLTWRGLQKAVWSETF